MIMQTRAEIVTAWQLLLDEAQPVVEKPAHLVAVNKILDSFVNKLSDTWPPPVKSLRNAPPGAPSTGDRYAVGPSPSGSWAGHANTVATWDGTGWGFVTPPNGSLALCTDTDMVLQRRNSEWMQRFLVATQRFRSTGPSTVDSILATEVWSLAGTVSPTRRYRVNVELVLSCDNATHGITLGLHGPTSTTVVVDGTVPEAAGSAAQGHVAAFGDVVASTSVPAANTPFRATLNAIIAPSEDGSIVLTAAVNDAADTLTVLAGSTMEITDITD